MEKAWDADILGHSDSSTEDWLTIVNRLRRSEPRTPTREQLRFWYLQLQPKQQWTYAVYRASAEAPDDMPSIPVSPPDAR